MVRLPEHDTANVLTVPGGQGGAVARDKPGSRCSIQFFSLFAFRFELLQQLKRPHVPPDALRDIRLIPINADKHGPIVLKF